jgi:hypothetical protein
MNTEGKYIILIPVSLILSLEFTYNTIEFNSTFISFLIYLGVITVLIFTILNLIIDANNSFKNKNKHKAELLSFGALVLIVFSCASLLLVPYFFEWGNWLDIEAGFKTNILTGKCFFIEGENTFSRDVWYLKPNC